MSTKKKITKVKKPIKKKSVLKENKKNINTKTKEKTVKVKITKIPEKNKEKLVKKVIKKPVKKKITLEDNIIKLSKEKISLPKITVIGVGGSGNNAINYMIKKGVANVRFIAVNTDLQDLNQTKANKKIRIGESLTCGTGAGMNPEVGRKAALEATEEIMEALKGTDTLFITGGMGGGTGTGATPVIISIAKDLGILTIAVVTKPFKFEGQKRDELAIDGIRALAKDVDSYIVIENNKLLEAIKEDATLEEAFSISDEVLCQAVEGISDLITRPGIINIDYADVQAVLEDSKLSLIGIGSATGADRAKKAAYAAIHSPLIDISTKGAGSILFSISSTGDLKMTEITEIAECITQEASLDSLIKFGTAKNMKLKKGEIKVTVIASNFDKTLSSNNKPDVKSFGLKINSLDDNIKKKEKDKFSGNWDISNEKKNKINSDDEDVSTIDVFKSIFK